MFLNGVVETGTWLEEDFWTTDKVCSRLSQFFEGVNPRELYNYLSTYGMYEPNRRSFEAYEWLKNENIWKKIKLLHRKYQIRWKGPDIKIFIFPMNNSGLFRNRRENKSGISFPDKMFLFISPLEDQKELEALFIHEYHHICRIRAQKRDIEDYCLIDSITLEGAAELTVEKLCGRKYRAKWCSFYSERELEGYWNHFIKENLCIKRTHRLHDAILFGRNGFPKLIGYAAGYHLVKEYFRGSSYSESTSLSVSPEIFLEASPLQD